MNVFLDIETIPEQPEESAKALIAETIEAPAAMKKPETIKAWHDGEGKYEGVKEKAIDDAYRKIIAATQSHLIDFFDAFINDSL